MNVLLISPNGLHELSGGGLYLRSIASALCAAQPVSRVTVISKDVDREDVFAVPPHCEAIYLKKDSYRDIAARLGLIPTYLGTYRSEIHKHVALNDVILFHNSRCGPLMESIRREMPNKRYGVVTDNVEAELKQLHRGKNLAQKLTNAIETSLLQRAERQCSNADFITFITEADKRLFETLYPVPARSSILPICVAQGDDTARDTVDQTETTPTVLFTAHFGFEPNRTALAHLAEVAREFQRISHIPARFVAAGAQAASAARAVSGISVVDSPSASLMASTFAQATVYLAPVSWGSGMKTKVAEALSYGLPVICLPNAAIGYEAIFAESRFRHAVQVVPNVAEMASTLHKLLQQPDLQQFRAAAKAAFTTLYSLDSQTQRLEQLL